MIGPLEIGIGFVLMLALMFLGLHVATVMFIVAMVGATLYLGQPAVFAFGNQLWGATEDYVLLSIPLYILTLGLFHVVINALMLWITAWITEHTTHWGLQITHFWWTAIWAAIVLSIVGWLFSLPLRSAERAVGG